MGKFTVVHEIHCNAETFWKTFLDTAFTERLFREGLGFPEYTVRELQDTDREVIRKAAGKPKMDLPGPVAKLFGNNTGYTEEGRLNKATQVWTWKVIPQTLADKLRQEGTLRVEAIGENKVRRIAEMVVEAKVFGIGGLIESSSEKQLREGWDASAAFMNRYFATNAG